MLDEGLVLPRLEARDREGVLREMAAALAARHAGRLDADLLDKLLKREELGTTAIGKGVAVPHCRATGLASPVLLLGLSKDGVPFQAVDGKPSAAIASLTRRSRALASKLLKAPTPAEVLRTLRAEEEKPHG